MSDSAPTYVCTYTRAAQSCRGARCARARAEIRSLKDESIHGEAALPQRRAPLDYDPMGPRAPFPTPTPSTPSVSFQSRDLHLSLHPFPSQHLTTTAPLPSLSFSLSLPRNVFPCRSSTKPHARRSIGNCLAALDNVQLT